MLAEGPMEQVQNDERVIEVYPGSLSRMLTVEQHQPVLRRQPHPARRRASTSRPGKCTALLGPQRRRQDDAAEVPHGPAAGRRPAASTFDGSADHARARRTQRARARHRLRAAGPRDLPAADGRGEPARWAWRTQSAARADAAAHLRAVPGAEEMLRRRGGDLSGGQQQQLAIGRALALRAEAADPRRADRRHPAVDHQGHRARDPHARATAARWRSCWSSSTTTSRARSRTSTS